MLKNNSVGKLFATTRTAAPELSGIADPRLVIVQMDADSDESVKSAAEKVNFKDNSVFVICYR